MNKLLNVRYILAGFLALGIWSSLSAQEEISPEDYTPGVSLQNNSGDFSDPVTHHGWSVSMNGGIGLTDKIRTFGYDGFAINSRWVPGSSKFGQRIAITFGGANWYIPSYSKVYNDTVLTTEEREMESENVNSYMAGLAFQLLSDRSVRVDDFEKIAAERKRLSREIAKATGAEQKDSLSEERKNLVWGAYRNAMRRPSWLVGANLRLVSLENTSDVDVIDWYTVFAAGKSTWDITAAAHYIQPREESLLLRNAYTFSTGIFIDLDDIPPVNTMGLSITFGQYNFPEKERTFLQPDGSVKVERNKPSAYRVDILLQFSDIFKGTGPFGTSIGLRYSLQKNKNFEQEEQLAVLLTTQFINLSKKEKEKRN